MDDSTGGIPWINLWHDERNLLSSIGKEERTGGVGNGDQAQHMTQHKKLPGCAIFFHMSE
jgi:hypothetical protein